MASRTAYAVCCSECVNEQFLKIGFVQKYVFSKKNSIICYKKQNNRILGIFYIIFAIVNTLAAEGYRRFGNNLFKFTPSINGHISGNVDFWDSSVVPKRL